MNRLFEPMFGHQIKSECDIFLKTNNSYVDAGLFFLQAYQYLGHSNQSKLKKLSLVSCHLCFEKMRLDVFELTDP